MRLASFERIIASLNEADVRALVAGGLAVVAHGYGRLTVDVDLVIQLTPSNVIRAFQALACLGYQPRVPITPGQFADPTQRVAWIRDKGMMVLNLFSDLHRHTTIDVFAEEPFDFDEAYGKALVQTLEGGTVCRFVDLTTLIRMKEQAGRSRDLDDVRHLRMLQEDAV
ncbi:hypothetical protein JXA88_12325 [Candidatus Fermentibacteria bacterium]|nr:hypothetical protein [Candidatus Fermentibacteria bacterium]